MAAFVDVILRGITLASASLALGGIAWVLLVLRAEAHAKPDAATARSLRVVAGAAWVAGAAQLAVMGVALSALTIGHGESPVGLYFDTAFARVATLRVMAAIALGILALRIARRPAGRAAWLALPACALGLIVSSAALSHAVARLEGRALLLTLDAVHQLGVAVWVGGLAHLTMYAAYRRRDPEFPGGAHREDGTVVRRFSSVALGAVVLLSAAGGLLTFLYVGEAGALVGTAYGVMVLSKIVLFAGALALGFLNFRVARDTGSPPLRLFRYAEVELGLALTVIFAAASLTSLPPAVDVREDRATPGEVAGRFTPSLPRLASPPVAELIRVADPLMGGTGERKQVEREWSEYNHHWAGLFVLAAGLLAALERLGVRTARHWPLVFLGLAVFLFVRNDPRAWPLGPAGFWESFALPDVLQHRAFVVLVVAFGVFEWMVRTGRLPSRPWAYVFPMLCAVGGGLLLTHSHAMFNLKQEFLVEVTHAPIGILGTIAGWARWLELRLSLADRMPGWVSTACLTGVGVLLLIYRES